MTIILFGAAAQKVAVVVVHHYHHGGSELMVLAPCIPGGNDTAVTAVMVVMMVVNRGEREKVKMNSIIFSGILENRIYLFNSKSNYWEIVKSIGRSIKSVRENATL